ncbi:hypothetical protein M3Y99_01711300 [Aphelenchoides fujianensis]|nr:hypothetical protein M3Y99_01711300 [Aphelenchoides fujianensis]
MNLYAFGKTHVHRACLHVAFYSFALSLLNAKSLVAIFYNVASAFSFLSSPKDENNVVATAQRVYVFYLQAIPESRGLVYMNVFIAAVCCLLLAHANRELRPSYYWPFFAFSVYKMFQCASELLESTVIIMHKVPALRISQQAATIHFVLFVGIAVIILMFTWAYFLEVAYRSKKFIERELLDPHTGLPLPLLPAFYACGPPNDLPSARPADCPPPPFDWKPGDPVATTPAPAYRP